MTEIKTFLDYIVLSLRYIISGFVCILVILYVDEKHNLIISLKEITNQQLFFSLGFASLAGVCIYAIHYAFLDKVFYWIILVVYRLFRKHDPRLYKEITEWNDSHLRVQIKFFRKHEFATSREYLFALVGQGYLRKSCDNNKVKAIQKEMETKMALLMFLYGCCYALILVPILYEFLFKGAINPEKTTNVRWLGILFLLVALRFDWRITVREIWITKNFFQVKT